MRAAHPHRWLVVGTLAIAIVACRKTPRPTYEYESPVTHTWTGSGPGAAGAAPPATTVPPPPTATTVPTLPAIVAPPTTTPAAPAPTSTTRKRRGAWVRPSDP